VLHDSPEIRDLEYSDSEKQKAEKWFPGAENGENCGCSQ
jgi:hypothetical protein